MNLLIIRDSHTIKSASGKLFFDGDFFCYTLEDTIRGYGIKIPGHTGIPAGQYKVKVSMSNRFKRLLPMIYTRNGFEIFKDGVYFSGVRMHGGNDVTDSDGCVLVAHNRVNKDKIYGSAAEDVVHALGLDEHDLIIKNS